MATVYRQKAKAKRRQIATGDPWRDSLLADLRNPAKVFLFCVPIVWLIWLIVNG